MVRWGWMHGRLIANFFHREIIPSVLPCGAIHTQIPTPGVYSCNMTADTRLGYRTAEPSPARATGIQKYLQEMNDKSNEPLGHRNKIPAKNEISSRRRRKSSRVLQHTTKPESYYACTHTYALVGHCLNTVRSPSLTVWI